MSIKVYQSKQGKKLYEVYVGVKARGKILQKRRRKDFQGNFISSLPTAKRIEFELKRELLGQRDGQPIWKWKSWLEECLRRMRFSLTYSTIINYEKILGKWVPKYWSQKELGNFKKADVHYLIFEDMLSSTPHQKGKVYKMLKRIFQLAVEEGVINKNPTNGIQVRVPAPKQKVLTSNEANTLLKEAQTCNHRFYAHWTVALFTGMRNGEIYALRVSDVDLEAGIIHVSKQFTSRDGLHETKTNLSRVVPIADELKPLLKWFMSKGGFKETLWKWKDEAKQEKVSFVWENLLLPRVREWKQGDQSRFLRDFCRGIGIPEVKFHDLRATFITNMLSKCVALNVVMSIVGHRRIATTDIYNRLAGVGVKGSTNKISYGSHFHSFPNNLLIPFTKRIR